MLEARGGIAVVVAEEDVGNIRRVPLVNIRSVLRLLLIIILLLMMMMMMMMMMASGPGGENVRRFDHGHRCYAFESAISHFVLWQDTHVL